MPSREFTRALRSIRVWAEQARTETGALDLAGLRDATDGGFIPVPEGITILDARIGELAAEWVLDRASDPARRLLYLHGGGYLAGGLASHRPLVAAIARASGCSVLVPAYRLAPEHPFPAAVEDAVLAYQYLRAHGPRGDAAIDAVPGGRVFIAGDSAGGGLTLACMLRTREGGIPLPHAAVTLSAYTDCALTGDSMRTRAEVDPVIGLKMIPEAVALYLAGADPRDPLASPLYGDPAGFPPLLMQVGDAELLRDDTVRFAERARERGVDVTLEVWPDMIHVWQLFTGVFPEAQAAVERVGAFLRAH
ncbi:MAG: alpha/beta hydrolase [Myxococcales bacterium]|nr:alpha/beta hydrolase [Myxococcales bacterium]MCB9753304.1 alpha/beta hydrolase [Myxococcales bacterium]